jgi:DNA polymerase III delta prime subunit
MTTEANNTTERNALNALAEYVALHIRKNEGIIKDYMEALAENFMESFEWKLKTIYKCNLKLEYLVEINKLLAEDGCTEEAMEFYLRHTIEDKTDDIVHARSKFANCTATLAQR